MECPGRLIYKFLETGVVAQRRSDGVDFKQGNGQLSRDGEKIFNLIKGLVQVAYE